MANESIPPPIIWAQRNDKIYVTINVEDCKEAKINFDENKATFEGHGGADNKRYAVTIEFYKEINPKESKYAVLARHIPMIIKKKEDGPYWSRLLKDAKKVHWLKTDFNKWRDEDDSDFEDAEDSKFEEMMQQMGNFTPPSGVGGMGDAGLEPDQDSDDDDLPDLE